MRLVKNGWERVRGQKWVGRGTWSKIGGSGSVGNGGCEQFGQKWVGLDPWVKIGGSESNNNTSFFLSEDDHKE